MGAPASADSVAESDPVLQPPPDDHATIPGGRGTHVTVTLAPPTDGKKKLTAWCWRFVSRFIPTINDKNVVCLVKKLDGTPCHHLMKWTPSSAGKRGSGTSGLNKHLEKCHKDVVKEARKEGGTEEERKGPIRAAIGKKRDK